MNWLVGSTKKYNKNLNYIKHLLILAPALQDAFQLLKCSVSLVGISISIASSAVGLNICAITAWIKSISQQLRKRMKDIIK